MNEPITTAAELDRDRARGLYGKFDVRRTDPLRRQMEDLEVRAGSEALREFQPRCPVHDMPDCSPLLNGCSLPAVIRTQLDEEADRIESEG